MHRLGHFEHGRRTQQLVQRQPVAAQGPRQLLAPVLDGVLTALPAEPLADLVAGPGRGHDLQPVPRRPGGRRLRGEDLDRVGRVELRLERDQPAVDPGPDAAVPDLGVDDVGEVDRRRAGRQRDDLALGREDVDLVLLEVELERLEELDRVVGLAVDVGDPLQPGHVGGGVLLLLVAPVRRDAVLGPVVHRRGADLHLDRVAVQPDHRRVQRLVHVELGRVDVVLEAALHRGPDGVDGPEGGPAVLLAGHHDPDGHQVVDVVELLAPDDHLLVDAPQVLRASGDVGLDAHVLEPLAHVDEDPGEILLALRRPGRHHLLDFGVALGVQRGEGQVLELPAHLLHAEAVRQRRVDVERLLGRAALLPLGHDGQGAHVVQPVGQLDQQHPPVVGHGHEHFADGGGLLRLLRVELEAVELGDPVHHLGHPGPERLGDRLEGEAGVLHRVVQERGGHGLRVEAELGHDGGHGDGVRDVRLAGAPELPVVGREGDAGGRHDGGGVVVGPVTGELGQERARPCPRTRAPHHLRRESPEPGSPSLYATRSAAPTPAHPAQAARAALGSALALLLSLAGTGRLARATAVGAGRSITAVPGARPSDRAPAPDPGRIGPARLAGPGAVGLPARRDAYLRVEARPRRWPRGHSCGRPGTPPASRSPPSAARSASSM